MFRVLNRFSLDSAKWNTSVVLALAICWLAVIVCAVSSINGQPFDRRQRLFWLGVVILLPFLGVLAYLPFAFRKEELPHIFFRRSKKPNRRRDPDPLDT